jgi:protease IV
MNYRLWTFRFRSLTCASALVLMSSSWTLTALGQQTSSFARAERVPDPGRAVASSDDSSGLVVNPANLTFMPGGELRWNWVRTGEGSSSSARGHSFALAGALPFGVATGLRMDFMRPPADAPVPYQSPFTWLTWGLSVGAKSASLGAAISHIYSTDPRVDGLTSVSIGATLRPTSMVSIAAVAHDANSPRSFYGAHTDRSYSAGAAIRPTGSSAFELGIEGRYYTDTDQWVPRATLGLQVPYVGRVRGDLAWFQPLGHDRTEYMATASLDIMLPHVTLTGGGIFGSAIGGKGGAGFVSGIAVTGWRERGVPAVARAVRIRIQETPGARSHVRLLRRLWTMSTDPEVAAVLLHLKTEPASSLAHASELADAVDLLRARGKKVICHIEAEGGRSLYVCAHADRTVINPAGGIRFSGLKSQYTYLAGLLTKLGVRAEFVRIGAYKSAPEQFTEQAGTPPALQEHEQNLREAEAEMVADIARGRHLNPSALRASIAQGPFTAPEALRAHLVDGYAYDDELRTVASETLGRPVALEDPSEGYADRTFGVRPAIAVVYLEGDMIDGESRRIPLVDMRMAGSYTIAKALRTAREDSSIRAVVLRIESPGGSSMAADVIWREAELTAREKPLIVSMGAMAASGGYYAAAAGKLIYATPYTLTGSIGIFYGKADVAQLLTKIGVNVQTLRTAPRADAESIFRPFTDEERAALGGKVKQFYDVFVDRVARGRHMSPAEVDGVARGRVWMGRQAVAHRLVDRLGGIRQALDEARRMTGLPDDARIEELPPPDTSLLGLVASAAGVREAEDETIAQSVVPGQVSTILRTLAPFVIYSPDQPMALTEVADTP